MAKNKKHYAFHQRLARWYEANGRKTLPWRTTRDPYAIYVSEIMLQQTQVKTVQERYYFQFLKRFPTLEALAAAKRQDVLKAWQGLGYYNRAVNLHEAAKQITGIRDWGLGIGERQKRNILQTRSPNPESLIPTLMSLPGIGRNTAHAVAAFAYHTPVAVMEANVKRVLSRIFALENPTADALWEHATALLDTKNPFDYNQAMMDIGAMVCTKRAPRCKECPANAICAGTASPESYPAAKIKKATPVRKKYIFLLRNNAGEYFAEPRKGKFLNGMYGFVEKNICSPLEGERARTSDSDVRAVGGKVCASRNTPLPNHLPQGEREYLGAIRQQYSHFTLEAEVYLQKAQGSGKDWHSFSKLKKFPFSMAELKILKLLEAA